MHTNWIVGNFSRNSAVLILFIIVFYFSILVYFELTTNFYFILFFIENDQILIVGVLVSILFILQQLDVLKTENQRLRDENAALIRVISKLSK